MSFKRLFGRKQNEIKEKYTESEIESIISQSLLWEIWKASDDSAIKDKVWRQMENMRKLERGEKDRSFPAKARCEAIRKITDESFLRTVLTNYSDKRILETTREKMKSIGLDPIYHKVPEIHEVNKLFESLKNEGFIDVWHLPFENVMTRLAACIFFFTPTDESKLEAVWKKFGEIPNFYYRRNEEKKMSSLDWRVEFNEGVDKL